MAKRIQTQIKIKLKGQSCLTCCWKSVVWCKVSHFKWVKNSRDYYYAFIIFYLCNPSQALNVGSHRNPGTQSLNWQVRHFSQSPCLEGCCAKLWPLKYSFLPCFCALHNQPPGSQDSEQFHLLRSDFLPHNVSHGQICHSKKWEWKTKLNTVDHPQRYSVSDLCFRKIRNMPYTMYHFLLKLHSLPSISGKTLLEPKKKKSMQRTRCEVLASQPTKPSWHRSLVQ